MERELFIDISLKGRTSLFIYNNHSCLIWKSHNVPFNQAIKELRTNFPNVDFVISDQHVKSFINYEYDHKEVQSPLFCNQYKYSRFIHL